MEKVAHSKFRWIALKEMQYFYFLQIFRVVLLTFSPSIGWWIYAIVSVPSCACVWCEMHKNFHIVQAHTEKKNRKIIRAARQKPLVTKEFTHTKTPFDVQEWGKKKKWCEREIKCHTPDTMNVALLYPLLHSFYGIFVRCRLSFWRKYEILHIKNWRARKASNTVKFHLMATKNVCSTLFKMWSRCSDVSSFAESNVNNGTMRCLPLDS